MSGSFWKFSNGFTSLSNISSLIESHVSDDEHGKGKPREVLLKLLDESDLLQELLANNSMLLEFLRTNEVLELLVELVVNEGQLDVSDQLAELDIKEQPEETEKDAKHESQAKNDAKTNDDMRSDDDDDDDNEDKQQDEATEEERRSRHAALAAEILSADVWSLTDTVMDSTANLNKLWSVLDSVKPLSINLSTYFMKIMEHLLDMKCDEMVTYLIENQPRLVDKFIRHLSNPPLMDFLLKLISTDKPDNSTGIIDFLQKQNLITHLIDALDIDDINDNDAELALVRQLSAADFLKALITISANSTTDSSTIGPNELTRELVSYDQMEKLCTIMLKGGYALANGVGIIIEIIRKNNSDYDALPVLYITLESHPPTGRDPIYLGHLLQIFGGKIDQFNKLLVTNREASKLKTPFGEIEPLGFERFKICELVAELLHCSNMALLNDNKGYNVVKQRDELRMKMKEYDPISFKYNEVIALPTEDKQESESNHNSDEEFGNDTIDSFNSRSQSDGDSIFHGANSDENEPHANANLTEEQIRENPVIGDFLKVSLLDTRIISSILAMFFKFPWNNFLHNVVFDIVQQVLNGSMDIGFNKFLAIDLFDHSAITDKIIEGQKLCSDFEESNKGLRLGYMGHLTLIAEEVVKFIQVYPVNTLSELIDKKVEDEVWEEYVNHVLYDTREKYNAILGGGDDDDDASNTFEQETFFVHDYKPGLVLDPNTDHDIGHLDASEDANKGDSESEDDDDHFTNYMSEQLTNTSTADLGVPGEEDPYIDPNDDGLSYKKSNSFYDNDGVPRHLNKTEDVELLSESSTSSSSSDDEDLIFDDDHDDNDKGTNNLTRAASKG